MASTSTHVQCWDGCADLKNVKRCIRQGHPTLVIMRGVPGSGKSHLARELVSNTNGTVLSTDDFFVEGSGYKFDGSKLQDYHKKNLNAAKAAMACDVKPIIIDNTNIYAAHMMPYVTQALRFKYEIYFVEPQTDWKNKAGVCARKNGHGILQEKILYLLDTYEKVSLSYMIKPTVLRLSPPPTCEEFDDDSAMVDVAQNPFSVTNGNSWAGLLPTVVQDKKEGLFGSKVVPLSTLSSLALSNSCFPETSGYSLKATPKTDANSSDSGEPYDSIAQGTDDAKPLFSLLPESQVQLLPCKSVGVQTNDVIRTLYVGGLVPTETICEAVVTTSEVFMKEKPRNERDSVVSKERSSQAAANAMPSELDLLLLMFPFEASGDLLHLLQIRGFENTIGICLEMHAQLDLFAEPREAMASPELLRLSETYDVVPDQIYYESNGDSEDQGNSGIAENPGPSRVLPPSSTKKCSPEPIKDGHYRMELSIDMIRKLSELFGDGETTDVRKAYADLPLWFCRQLYQHWQGLPISNSSKGGGFNCNDFNSAFPSVVPPDSMQVENDEDLARDLQCFGLNLNGLETVKPSRLKLTTAQKIQLKHLCEEFSSVDRERIVECYCDTNFSVDAVRNTLNLFLEQEDEPKDVHIKQDDSGKLGRNGGYNLRLINGDKGQRTTLEAVQGDVLDLQEEIDYCMEQRDGFYEKASTSKVAAVKQFYISDAQRFDKQARALMEKKNEKITNANSNNTFVDLHHMNVPAAIKLLKEKLSRLDRPPNLRNGRSDRKLVVVTGYGKSSNGPIKIKPAVIQWLKQSQYDYHLSNPGEIVVTAK